jgi:hypothetical protein
MYSSKPQPTRRSGSAIQMRNSISKSQAYGEPYCRHMKSVETVLTRGRDTDDPRNERFVTEFCLLLATSCAASLIRNAQVNAQRLRLSLLSLLYLRPVSFQSKRLWRIR